MEVGDAHFFLAFSHQYYHNFSFQSHRLLFSDASAEVRGKNIQERKFASTGDQTHNHQVMRPTRSPLSHPGGAYIDIQSALWPNGFYRSMIRLWLAWWIKFPFARAWLIIIFITFPFGSVLTLSQTSQCLQYKSWNHCGKKEKLLVMSNFSFSHSVFYPFGELSAIFILFGEGLVCTVCLYITASHWPLETDLLKGVLHPFQHCFSHIKVTALMSMFFLGFTSTRLLGLWSVLSKDTSIKRTSRKSFNKLIVLPCMIQTKIILTCKAPFTS